MTLLGSFHDPLAINLQRQTKMLLEQLPPSSPARVTLQNVPTRADLLTTLSFLLATPNLTLPVATAFRPLLLDLCARWLLDSNRLDDKLEAFCLILELHPELFP